ncbi:MAG: hypothetical protein ACJ79L_01620 [Anaeromyxobacteraceae bacterium]
MAAGCWCAAAIACAPCAAFAQGLAFSLEPGIAVAGLGSQRLQLPSAASIRALLGIGPCLDLALGAGYVGLPALSDATSPMSGMASMYGVGLRLKRPHDERSWRGASPWVDVEVLSVRADAGDRRAVAIGAGIAVPLRRDRAVWVGPFVRYVQVTAPSTTTGAGGASDGVFAGLTLEIGAAMTPAR